ncbi:flagellar hook-associated protein FlgK [Ciceribacter sp. L1K23]|uniref:flagellar hook-associated protein FlgK n=1 Tax=Ciceribacter sp. L1K23 TaxID=2820276 RepID=UPI001B83B3BE|nr:flagellar hook-associated protein FlgK [Ciceribacter sp. L1K23]MBR0556987.1 flagellar hook-associated protein FlgK [Ciceribacter sp. L1K23]
MTLTSALHSAKSVFTNSGETSAVISKNIANAGNENYVKRSTVVMTTLEGATVVATNRAEQDVLQRQMFLASSESSGQDVLLDGLEQLQSILGGNDYELAPSTYLAEFYNSLEQFAAKPGELSLAQTTVSSAVDVVNSLNNASNSVQQIRAQADKDISTAVGELNDLLTSLDKVNRIIVQATATGDDPNDALDQRDAIVKDISKLVGVTVQTRDNNDIVLYTADGTALYETIPRTVSFAPTMNYDANVVGNSVYIDGIPVNLGVGGDTTARGSIAASLQIRDEIAPVFQSQLDEVARGLITAFAETDPATIGPDMPGLFTWPTGTTLTTGTIEPGLAALIAVNPLVQQSAGGDPMLLRDGMVYDQNPDDLSGFTDLLSSFLDNMTGDMVFDPATQLDDNTSLLEFSTNSVGWLEQYRSNASSGAEKKTAMLLRAEEAYTSETGVSLDEELSLLLDVEQSYKAASKLLSTVDEMLQALIAAAG